MDECYHSENEENGFNIEKNCPQNSQVIYDGMKKHTYPESYSNRVSEVFESITAMRVLLKGFE